MNKPLAREALTRISIRPWVSSILNSFDIETPQEKRCIKISIDCQKHNKTPSLNKENKIKRGSTTSKI